MCGRSGLFELCSNSRAERATGPRPRPLRVRWFNSRVTDAKQKRAAPEAGAALFSLVEAAGVE